MARIGTSSQRAAQAQRGGRYQQQQTSGTSMPAYQPQPQSYSARQTQYAQSPAPVLDPYGEARYQGMSAAASKADPYAAQRGGYLQQLQQMSQPGYQFSPTDPSYAFRFKQGQGALESSLAARGLLGAGGAALELQEYGQQAGAQEFQSQFQRLQQLAGMGDPAAAARLEQEAVEGRYRTYQPTMMETGSTETQYSFPGAGGSGGGGGGGRGVGSTRRPQSAFAKLMRSRGQAFPYIPGHRASADRWNRMQYAARAEDLAQGFDPMSGWKMGLMQYN